MLNPDLINHKAPFILIFFVNNEVRQIKSDFKRRGDYFENEVKKIEHEISITEKQKFMQDEYFNSLKERLKEAERNAIRRFNN